MAAAAALATIAVVARIAGDPADSAVEVDVAVADAAGEDAVNLTRLIFL